MAGNKYNANKKNAENILYHDVRFVKAKVVKVMGNGKLLNSCIVKLFKKQM